MRARPAPPHDGRVRRLPLLARLAALGQYARRASGMATPCGAALAASHGMADRVLRCAALVRLAALPAFAARLAQAQVHVFGIADHADRRPALRADATYFPGGHRQLRPLPLAG